MNLIEVENFTDDLEDCLCCSVCETHKHNEKMTFIDEQVYCFECAPDCCLECDQVLTEDDKVISECNMCAKCFLYIGNGKVFTDEQIKKIADFARKENKSK